MKKTRPNANILGKLSLHYLLGYIRFIAQIRAENLLIHKEKIQVLYRKTHFSQGGEETSPLENDVIPGHDLESSAVLSSSSSRLHPRLLMESIS